MNTLGSSVTKNRRMVEWEKRERVVRGRANAQRLTEKGQQGQDLKSVDIGAMAKADCASCWRDPGLEFSSPEVGPTSRPAFSGYLDHPCQGSVSPRMGRVYHGTTTLLPLASALLVLAGWQAGCSARCGCRGRGLALPGVGSQGTGQEGGEPSKGGDDSETCLLRASSVKGSAGEDGAPPTGALCCVSNQLECCNPRGIHSLMGNHKC